MAEWLSGGLVVRSIQTDGYLVVVHAANHPSNTQHTNIHQTHQIGLFTAPFTPNPTRFAHWNYEILSNVCINPNHTVWLFFVDIEVFEIDLHHRDPTPVESINKMAMFLYSPVYHTGYVHNNLIYVQPSRVGREMCVNMLIQTQQPRREELLIKVGEPITDVQTSNIGHVLVLTSSHALSVTYVDDDLKVKWKASLEYVDRSMVAIASSNHLYCMHLGDATTPNAIHHIISLDYPIRQVVINQQYNRTAIAHDGGVDVVSNFASKVIENHPSLRAPIGLVGFNLRGIENGSIISLLLQDSRKRMVQDLLGIQRRSRKRQGPPKEPDEVEVEVVDYRE